MAHTASAATVGPVTDDLGVIRIAKGAPIQIGAYWVLSGADTALGLDEKRGVEIAFKELGGKVLNHPLKLNAEDDGCNAEGGQTAATKLAANPQTVEIAQRTLSAICHATGRMQVQDSEELHLIPLMADVQVQPPKNGYGESNKVRYLPLERGAKPAASQPASAASPQQSQPATPAAAFTSAPWKRQT
jgi:hypothetical protein